MRRADRYAQIRARRERLIAKADLQRDELSREITVWQPAIGVLDRGLAGYAWIRAHPEILVAAGAVQLGAPLRSFDVLVLTLAAALPSASNVSLLAERYGADNGRIARIIMSSTALSFGTFTLLAWAFGVKPG